VCVIGGFRAWVSVRGQNTQFVQYKNQYVYESPPHKDSKPDVCVCVCVGLPLLLKTFIYLLNS